MKNTARFLSVCHWAISDKAAGIIAKRHATAKRLPPVGKEVFLGSIPGLGDSVILARTPCRYSDLPQKKRGWTWCIYGDISHKQGAGASFTFTV
jgi:hypothetical protein